jgi:hypothetical protein
MAYGDTLAKQFGNISVIPWRIGLQQYFTV